MSKTVRIDGRRVVDHDINGVPILEGQALPLPRYDIPTLDECRVIVAPLVEDIRRRAEAKRAEIEATPEGRARLAAAREKARAAGGMSPAKMIDDFGNWPAPEVAGRNPS